MYDDMNPPGSPLPRRFLLKSIVRAISLLLCLMGTAALGSRAAPLAGNAKAAASSKSAASPKRFASPKMQTRPTASATEAPATVLSDKQQTELERLLSEGEDTLREGDYEKAAQIFQSAAQKAPKDPRPYVALGRIHFLQSKTEDSLSDLQSAIKLGPNFAPAHFEMGMTLMTLGKLDQAAVALQRAVELDPSRAQYHYQLGQLKMSSGSEEAATSEFSRALQLDPQNAGARVALARRLSASGLVEDAIAQCRAAIAISPQDPALPYQLGVLYEKEGKPKEAIEAFRKALSLNPKDWQSLKELATVYGAGADWANARDSASRWADLEPDNPAAQFTLAWSAMATRELGEAKDAFEKCIQLDGNNPELYNAYGLLLQDMGKWSEAETAFAQVLQLSPEHVPAQLNIAMVYLNTGRYLEAEKLIDKLSAGNPPAPFVVSAAAYVYAKLGKFDLADKFAGQALQQNGEDVLARVAQALVAGGRGDIPKQVTELEQALASAPDSVFVINELADGKLKQGLAKDAAQMAQQSLQISPGDLHAKQILALAVGAQGNWDGALLLLREVVARKKTDAEVRSQLAYALEMKGEFDDARLTYQQAAKLDPDASAPLLGLARLAIGERKVAKGIELIQQALKHHPDDLSAHLLLSEALYLNGRYSASLDECKQVLTNDQGNTKALCLFGRNLYRKKDWKGAADYFNKCLDGPTVPPEDWLLAASAMEKVKDLGAARKILQNAVAAYPRNQSLSASLQRVSSKLR